MNVSKIMLSGVLAMSVSAPAFSSKVYDEEVSESNTDSLSAELVINKRPRLIEVPFPAAITLAKQTKHKSRKISQVEDSEAEAYNIDLSPYQISTADTYFAVRMLMLLRQDEYGN